MADKIATLPTDNTPLNHSEISLMNALFEESNASAIEKAILGLKDVLIATAVVFVILLPFVDENIKKVFPVTVNSVYMMAVFKAVLFAILFFVLSNTALMKKE